MESLTLDYIERPPLKKTSEKPPLLILLHGYGSNEQDLFSFASELPDEFLIISVRAPLTLEMGAYAWYSISFDMNNGKFSDTDEAIASKEQIATFIDEVKARYEVDEERCFLLGFSQGAILSYAVALEYPEKVKHIIALSGYINHDILPTSLDKPYEHLDFYISHGTVDQVLPVAWAQQAPEFLTNKNIRNVYHEYQVGHGIAPQNFYDFTAWIQERL